MTDQEFQELCIYVQAKLQLTDSQMADMVAVSKPAFMRWKEGRNMPYTRSREAIANHFKRAMETREE